MTLTEADKAMVREMAREIVAEIGPDIAEKAAWNVITEHIRNCPIRNEFKIAYWKLIALVVGGTGVANVLLKLLSL